MAFHRVLCNFAEFQLQIRFQNVILEFSYMSILNATSGMLLLNRRNLLSTFGFPSQTTNNHVEVKFVWRISYPLEIGACRGRYLMKTKMSKFISMLTLESWRFPVLGEVSCCIQQRNGPITGSLAPGVRRRVNKKRKKKLKKSKKLIYTSSLLLATV